MARNIAAVLVAIATTWLAWPVAAEDLSGTWNVVCKPGTLNTCKTKGETSAYQWLVAAEANGSIAISVLGKTAFPTLKGTYNGKKLVVQGLAKDAEKIVECLTKEALVFAESHFVLTKAKKGGFKGKRYYEGLRKSAASGTTVVVPCVTDFSCTATRQ